MNFKRLIVRDTRANQPATAKAGSLYCVSDEGNIIERWSGAAWTAFSPTAQTTGQKTRTIGFVIGNGVDVITTGLKGFSPPIPYACTIVKWTLLSIDATGPATSGAIVVDIWNDAYSAYPPTNADSITASAKPTITATNPKGQSSTLTGWDTAIAANDVLGFEVESVTSLTQVLLALEVTVP